MKFYGLLFSFLLVLSSCYKEEHEIIQALSGRYVCKKWSSYMAGNTHVIDSSESVIEISEVPLYPRKFKTIVEGEKVVCALNFDNLQFDYDKKNGLKMHGSFFQTDSIRFSTTYGDCSGCGISSQTYLGVKE